MFPYGGKVGYRSKVFPMLKQAPGYKDVRKWGIAPCILELGIRWKREVIFTLWPSYLGKQSPHPLNRKLGLDSMKKRKIFSPTGKWTPFF
jgi:hypothetical protein